MKHTRLTARLYGSKESRMKRFWTELLGALAIVTLGFIVAAMFSFAACSSSEQCTEIPAKSITTTEE
tara:strand:+ start:74 stop:274 length:201 start_codon:yes stop_codon:yes gene_type:complete